MLPTKNQIRQLLIPISRSAGQARRRRGQGLVRGCSLRDDCPASEQVTDNPNASCDLAAICSSMPGLKVSTFPGRAVDAEHMQTPRFISLADHRGTTPEVFRSIAGTITQADRNSCNSEDAREGEGRTVDASGSGGSG